MNMAIEIVDLPSYKMLIFHINGTYYIHAYLYIYIHILCIIWSVEKYYSH